MWLNRKTLFWLIALLVTCLPVILPLTKPGYFPTHDGEWAVVRLAEMNREIHDRQIPPRWSDFLNHGYGYPLFLFTYPFPYYLGEAIHLVGFGLVDTIKILFIISVILSGYFIFLLGRQLVNEEAGFIAAVLYMYAPFRIVDIYIRGSLGESLSLLLFPLLFWLSLRTVIYRNLLHLILTSIAFATLILTHNIMALVFTPFWIIFLFISVKYYYEDLRKYVPYFLVSIILGLGLSSFFWLPALLEKKFILLSQIPLADIQQNFIHPMEFFNSAWNYGARPPFQLGWVHLILFISGVTVLLFSKGLERKKNSLLGIYILFSTAVLIFLTLPISSALWKLPPLTMIDFPWRLMTVLIFFLCLGTLFIADYKSIRYISVFLIIISFFLVPNFAKPLTYFQRNDDYYRNNDATTTSMNELMPIWVNSTAKNRYSQKVEVQSGQAYIGIIQNNSRHINFEVRSITASVLRINTIYFPGWEMKLDNQRITPNYQNPEGIITIPIPEGTHQIVGDFNQTPVRKVGDIISIISLCLVILFSLIYYVPLLRQRLRKI